MDISENYKKFISENKTERECINTIRNNLINCGFIDMFGLNKISDGDKIVATKMNKALMAFKIGKKPVEEGINILCAHVDSPRLDIKMNPLYNDKGLIFFDTHYYGGIRNYQWVARPLAIHGVVCKKDGSIININIGEKETDPIFYISDLLPHLAYKDDFISGEELDVIIGNNPSENDNVEDNILNILKETYNIERYDLQSSELEVVPAGSARDVGFDRNLIVGYGHDDRSCAYASYEAFIADNDTPERTSCLLLVDKEEIGSNGATGLDSNLLENIVAELIYANGGNELTLRRCLANSNILSSDVNAAFDPHHSDLFDSNNTSYLGKGAAFCKFTGSGGKYESNDANPEYFAKIRSILDEKSIPYQTSELGKVDKGGGGTIAYLAARYGMNTIDVGLPVLAMHAPCEIIDKRDLNSCADIYFEFLRRM